MLGTWEDMEAEAKESVLISHSKFCEMRLKFHLVFAFFDLTESYYLDS